jgi:uncharacterized membrane protein (UPF0127 family)
MQHVLIDNLTHPAPPSIQARYCESFFCRLRGLMFKKSLAADEGLLMVQPRADLADAAIHMLFMKFDIAVVWADEQRRVVDVKLARRWRPAYIPAKPAKYVLEIHSSRLADFKIGDQLVFNPC